VVVVVWYEERRDKKRLNERQRKEIKEE